MHYDGADAFFLVPFGGQLRAKQTITSLVSHELQPTYGCCKWWAEGSPCRLNPKEEHCHGLGRRAVRCRSAVSAANSALWAARETVGHS